MTFIRVHCCLLKIFDFDKLAMIRTRRTENHQWEAEKCYHVVKMRNRQKQDKDTGRIDEDPKQVGWQFLRALQNGEGSVSLHHRAATAFSKHPKRIRLLISDHTDTTSTILKNASSCTGTTSGIFSTTSAGAPLGLSETPLPENPWLHLFN